MSYIQIREIIRATETGVTKPYLCSDKDGTTYIVKSWAGMPPRELVYEWVCAKLAALFGLPCPEPCIMCDFGILFELGNHGSWHYDSDYAFASPVVEGAMELNYAQAKLLDDDFKRRLFVFDYWIKNHDRVLSEKGGRVNLLFDGSRQLPVVIDHNQALDPTFNAKNFSREHIFGYDNRPLFQLDLVHREELELVMAQALLSLNDIAYAMPIEWREAANEQLISGEDIIDDVIRPILDRYTKPAFWQDVEP